MRHRLSLAAPLVLALLLGPLGLRAWQTPRPSTLIDSAQLLHDLQVLSSDDMQGRQVDTPGGARARAYVIERFKAAGIKPFGASYEQPFTFAGRDAAAGDRHGVNVIGHIDGTRQPARYIVVSAHYDHIGVRNGQVFNGADDNASGTAALFALGKYFSTHPPQHSLIFAAFDGEESGLRGSQAFVKQPPVDLSAIMVDVNMDMIGRDPNDKLFAVGTRLNPLLKPYLERVAAAAPVKLLFGHEDPSEKEDWTKDSDHWSFQQAKIPAIYLGDEDFDQHHKATDDYETITYTFFIGATETALAVVKEFDANLEAAPVRPADRLRQGYGESAEAASTPPRLHASRSPRLHVSTPFVYARPSSYPHLPERIPMPKYMVQASYTTDGTKGLLRDGGSKRRAAVEKAISGLGGKIEGFYFSFGAADVVVIADLPDAASAIAVSLTTGASGSVRCVTTPLITPEEMDAACKKNVGYTAPGA
jgi:uncharacterized protein with GYD domain